jgi:excisionase family DNA binding protein
MTLDDFDHDLLLVEEARQVLRLGRRQVYEAVARGQIPVLKMGRSIRVPKAALRRLIEATGPPENDDSSAGTEESQTIITRHRAGRWS